MVSAEVTREALKFAERYFMEAKRLEIINKKEAKRASNATREHTTLVGVGLR